MSGSPHPSRLAYVVASSPRLEDWRRFASDILGVEVRTGLGGALDLRLDPKRFRLSVEPATTEEPVLAGWEFDTPDALDDALARLAAAGVKTTAADGKAGLLRGVERLHRFTDPAGNPVELCTGHGDGEAPAFRRPLAGFKTGDCGLGHVVYTAPDIAPLVGFYQDVLGFRLSDSAEAPFAASFMHVNGRHHSLAFVQTPRTGVHHIMVELYSLDDVGQAYDRAQLEEGRVAVTLGRHTNDFMTSFYAATPSDFMVEYGWGGRTIDPEAWEPAALLDGPSLWGHERQWLKGELREQALRMRLRAAEAGRKAPVQVHDGFFELNAAGQPARMD
jgi:2,3-dihydroxybiphenyl 1,2-dioxygenase